MKIWIVVIGALLAGVGWGVAATVAEFAFVRYEVSCRPSAAAASPALSTRAVSTIALELRPEPNHG